MATVETGEQAEARQGAWIGTGTGPVVLLLHGLGGTWHIWKPLLNLLAQRFRIIALTLPGHFGGQPYSHSGDATVAGLADQLVSDLAALGVQRAHVVGNSIGGWLSLELARCGFALSVTAFSPAGGWTTDADYRKVSRPFRIFYALMPLILLLTTLFLRFAIVRRLLGKTTMVHGERVPEADLRHALKAMAGTYILPGLLRTMGRDGPIAPLVADVPIRIAWSELDEVIPYDRYGVPMYARVPAARAETLVGAGHVPMYDAPESMVRYITETVAAGEGARAAAVTA